MNKADCIRRTDEVMASRRVAAVQTQAAHQAEIAEKIPEIIRIEKEMRDVSARFFADAMEKEISEEAFKEIKSRSLDLQKRRAELLFEHGYPLDYLEIKYACPECRDEGFIGQKMCKCYRKALSEQLLEESNMKKICKGQTFAKFDLSFYDEDDQPKMKKLADYAKKYASTFTLKSPNLLMLGAPGCGKTFLSCAIGSEVINKGYFVVYAPVQEMIDAFEDVKFGKNPDADTDCYTECDLLVIDDLGTEFSGPLAESVLYNVINTRLNLGKPMIISTNVSVEDMQGMYHDRLTSRMMYDFVKLPFCTKDIRREKEVRRVKQK